jgi:hypothetical protein
MLLKLPIAAAAAAAIAAAACTRWVIAHVQQIALFDYMVGLGIPLPAYQGYSARINPQVIDPPPPGAGCVTDQGSCAPTTCGGHLMSALLCLCGRGWWVGTCLFPSLWRLCFLRLPSSLKIYYDCTQPASTASVCGQGVHG